MDIETLRQAIDKLYEEGKAPEAERLMREVAAVAADEGEDAFLLQILNELIGHYRETGEWDKAFEISDRAVMIAGRLFPECSVPYATTLLNAASMYRAAGKLDISLDMYRKVELIYAEVLKADDMLYASLFNNEALLYQERGEFGKAKALLLKALDIDRANGKEYEEAVSLANIAATMIQTGETEEALKLAEASVALFENLGVRDQHLCAAFSAMGSYYYIKGRFDAASVCFKQGMDIMESILGKNGYYERLRENYEACVKAAGISRASEKDDHANGAPSGKEEPVKGIDICRKYYETYVRPMIDEKFPEYASKIAAGLVGEGSDAFGFDDELSRDHDWGPSVVLWISKETDAEIGDALRTAYEELPGEMDGIRRAPYVRGKSRRGVQAIPEFFERLTGAAEYEDIDWRNTESSKLAAAVNGEIWRDDEGIVTAFREKLSKGYPEEILFLNLAQYCALFSREGQYNCSRVKSRGDDMTSRMFAYDAIRDAMKLKYLSENRFFPHDKWLRKGLKDLEDGEAFEELLLKAEKTLDFEELGSYLAMELYRRDYISDIDPYLDHQTEELLKKSLWSAEDKEELAMKIAKLEFEAFDKVSNEGGRASCQDDWSTFNIMRRSQYLTWDRTMLLQYLYDFEREMSLGHNLITEKYGRMMEFTAPERYREIAENFPELSEEKKAIIEQIVKIQVDWMESFAAQYPAMGERARSIRTSQDNAFETSYETYLRGELGTYSDKMLELYARFIVTLSSEGRNLAYETMQNTAKLYGYDSIDKAESFFAR
ncbi:MAG: DUF4125 family protein [Lachnospiraceae bacterium]|nr:DUF4125 family protein [Lachnospiraceae bacterium]